MPARLPSDLAWYGACLTRGTCFHRRARFPCCVLRAAADSAAVARGRGTDQVDRVAPPQPAAAVELGGRPAAAKGMARGLGCRARALAPARLLARGC